MGHMPLTHPLVESTLSPPHTQCVYATARGSMGHLRARPARFSADSLLPLALACLLCLPQSGYAQNPNIPTYFEFGAVVSLGSRTIDIQTFDQQKQRLVQHSFILPHDARADLVHVGDTVEIIFTPGTEWTVRRLVLLTSGIPQAGPPTVGGREVPPVTSARIAPPPPAARIPATSSPALAGKSTSSKSAPSPASVALGTTINAKAAPVIDVPLGAGEAALPKTPKTKTVAFEVPREECNRSSADWPSQPLRLAVLDFRYPTEREEAHDIGTTGGGSGTAVADLIFSRLDQLNSFAMSRGDRTRLYRGDFAGAARVGRELGVDAVLAGTFQPLDPPPGSDPDFPPPKSYELKAGIVDTCTGQLLERLVSVECPPGLDPNAALNAPSCKVLSVTAKQATDPKEAARAFRAPIDALLNPLEHNGPPAGTQGTAGVVTVVTKSGGPVMSVTIKLPGGIHLQPGDQVAIHAWRLTKNPTTYTLQNLNDFEIGRVKLATIQSGQATGAFTGDIPPQPGDTAELIQP